MMSESVVPSAVEGFVVPSRGEPIMTVSGLPSGRPSGPLSDIMSMRDCYCRNGHLTFDDRQTTSAVQASYWPVAIHPELSERVGEAKSSRAGHGDKLALQTRPEVDSILVGNQGGIDLLDLRHIVRDREPAVRANIKSRELLRGRAAVLAQDERRHCVTSGEDFDISWVVEFSAEEVVWVVAVAELGDLAREGDGVSDLDRLEYA